MVLRGLLPREGGREGKWEERQRERKRKRGEIVQFYKFLI